MRTRTPLHTHIHIQTQFRNTSILRDKCIIIYDYAINYIYGIYDKEHGRKKEKDNNIISSQVKYIHINESKFTFRKR